MSAINIKHEFRMVLEIPVSNRKLTRNSIQRLVRKTDFIVKESSISKTIHIDNQIKIGTYTILLMLCEAKCLEPQHIRDYNGIGIRVFQNGLNGLVEVKMQNNSLFEDQEWIKRNLEFNLRMYDLINAIIFFMRLDRLKAFN